jgi:hypothetical protein
VKTGLIAACNGPGSRVITLWYYPPDSRYREPMRVLHSTNMLNNAGIRPTEYFKLRVFGKIGIAPDVMSRLYPG